MRYRPDFLQLIHRRSVQHRISRLSAVLSCLLVLSAVQPAALYAQDVNNRYGASQIDIFAGAATSVDGSGDGNPALLTTIAPTFALPPDSAGNVYFIDGIESQVKVVYAGGPAPLLTMALNAYASFSGKPVVTPTAGNIYTLVNNLGILCSPGSTCGDGGPAALAHLNFSFGMAFDSKGNLYIADSNDHCIRKVSVSDGTISTIAGDPNHSNSSFSGDGGFASQAFLTTPQSIVVDANDNLFIADLGANLVRRIDANTDVITTVAGDNMQPGKFCSDNICGGGGLATSALLGAPTGVAIDTAGDLFITEGNTNVLRKVDHASLKINTIAGTMGTPCGDSKCGDGQPAIKATLNYPWSVSLDPAGNPIIADYNDNAIRAVLPDGTITTLAGQITQSPSAPPGTGTGGPAADAQFAYPWNAALDVSGNLFIADGNPLIWKVNAPAPLKPQIITFTAIPSAVYGDPSIDLTHFATTDSGLAVTFTCAGPATCAGTNGATLTITGAGDVIVTASQAGNSTYNAATSVQQSLVVNKALLTVTANDINFGYKSAQQLPPLTYTITGFKYQDAQQSVFGNENPALATTATATSLSGQYPITISQGTLVTPNNYDLTFVPGTLLISGTSPQKITFNLLPNLTYGAPSFTLTATASSGLPVTYTVTPPAKILGSTVTIQGAGVVTVTANQAGNSQYAPASSVVQSFTVAPAVLTIAVQPAAREYAQPNPAFTYSSSGFVSADTASVLSGAPVFSSTATQNSVPGTYPLTISQGTLFASNYTFNFVNSTLGVSKATQIITLPQLPEEPFGSVAVPLAATSNSGLPIQYTATGGAAILAGNRLGFLTVGPATVTASAAGNDLYLPGSVTQSFNIVKGTLPVGLAQNYQRAFGAENPTFAYQFANGNAIPANQYSGAPLITTTATPASAPGVYAIVISQGTLVSPYWDFQFEDATLTVLPPSSIILTSTPSSITVPRGQARQVTITLTPVNDFVGTVTIGCSGLPAGVTCVASPAAVTTTLNVSGVSPVSTTLTISAGTPVASAQNRPAEITMLRAGWFWIPSLLFGALLTCRRKHFSRSFSSWQWLLFAAMLLGATSLIACGGGSKSGSGSTAQPGTSTIQVTGGGTSPSGQVSASVSLSLTIQ